MRHPPGLWTSRRIGQPFGAPFAAKWSKCARLGEASSDEDAERVARRICENEERLVGIVGPVKQDSGAEGFRAHALTP